MKVKLLVFLFLFLLVKSADADYVDTAWVRTYDGPAGSSDEVYAIAVDDSGNIYVTGYSDGMGTGYDFATIKYHPNGDTAWVRRYNGPASHRDKAYGIAVDDSGNVLVTGSGMVYTYDYFEDYVTIKYYPDGDTAWVRRYDGPANSHDEASAIAIDVSGNVYVTGYSFGYPDGVEDYATIKYLPDGDTAWVRRYNGPADNMDQAQAIAVDDSGNVYVTGYSIGIGTSYDYATIKYYPDGDTAWVRRYHGPGLGQDWARAMIVDDSGNVYVTGYSDGSGTNYDYATIKYRSNGDTAWVRRYGSGNPDYASAIKVDTSGNVYVTGYAYGIGTAEDYATIKYYPNGDTAWVRRYDGPVNDADKAQDLALDNSGNIYVTGSSYAMQQNADYVTVKYDPAGRQVWVAQYAGPGYIDDTPHAITVDQANHVLVTGASYTGEGDDYTTIKYLQYDSIPFAPAVNYGAGDGCTYVFCGDLDGDADLDLAVANVGDDNISILKNDGDGTFQTAVNYGAGDAPNSVFCADLDGDGDLDLAVANWHSDNISILKNNGDGTFQTAINYGAGDGSNSVFCADLDDDSDLDLAVANWYSDNISILKNNGDGTFQTAINYGAGDSPLSVFCADLDGDTDLDLAVANWDGDNISILKNNGDGTFQTAVNYGAGDGPLSVFCADLDGDTDLDLAAANLYSGNVSILKNNGNGTFQSAVNYGAGDGPNSVFCADLDGDSDLDLAVSNQNSDNISILKNNGDETFQTKVNYEAGDEPWSVFCVDLDADSDFDIAVANASSANVSILENLTQVPANQPPWAFSLVSPENEGTIFGTAPLRWHIPYDPNFGDQLRYDLYISTSPGFEPLYTIVNSYLWVSQFNAVLDSGYYYWKVMARDNWGAERWSTQTWSFDSRYLSDTLRIIAFSPVDLIVTDPIGDSISPWFNTIPTAFYDTTTDYNQDGDKDDIVTIPDRLVGEYIIEVVTEPGGGGIYELGIRIDGGTPAMLTMPGGAPCPGAGEVDTFNYNAPWYETGDANGDWVVAVGDVVYLINYLYKGGVTPDPLLAGDATCEGFVDVGDVVYLINYLFKGGAAPSC